MGWSMFFQKIWGYFLFPKVLLPDFILVFESLHVYVFHYLNIIYFIFFCRQLSVWMVMAAKFEVDLQQLQKIPILIHQLLAIHVIYGKV